jgi:hypothetical protein
VSSVENNTVGPNGGMVALNELIHCCGLLSFALTFLLGLCFIEVL